MSSNITAKASATNADLREGGFVRLKIDTDGNVDANIDIEQIEGDIITGEAFKVRASGANKEWQGFALKCLGKKPRATWNTVTKELSLSL